MKRKFKNTYKILIILAFVFLVILSTVNGIGGKAYAVFAESTKYTGVLDDLRKDKNFKIDDYKGDDSDYSLDVIQIAVSPEGELFLYVYNPCGITTPLTATKINMSRQEDASHTKLYNLTLLSRVGVFAKYLVDGVTTQKIGDLNDGSSSIEYFNITSIFRKYNEDYGDTGSTSESAIDETAFEVGKFYMVTAEHDNIKYECKAIKTVKIIEPFSDYLRYSNGFYLFHKDKCDSHYIAFSTEYKIDNLFEADVEFITRELEVLGNAHIYRNEQSNLVTLKYTDVASNPAGGWRAKKYTWNRIERASDFIKNEDLNEEALSHLKNSQWVLRFYESEYRRETTGGMVSGLNSTFSTEVSNVAILRLKFETDGIVYDLGAVSDIVTSDEYPGNNNTNETEKGIIERIIDFFKSLGKSIKGLDWWQWLLIGLAALLLVGLVTSIIIFGVKAVFSFILWLICLPFKGIKALINKIRGE